MVVYAVSKNSIVSAINMVVSAISKISIISGIKFITDGCLCNIWKLYNKRYQIYQGWLSMYYLKTL